LLEHCEKWRLRDQESPPNKEALTILDDDESDTKAGRKRNKGKLDGRKKAKDKDMDKEAFCGRKFERQDRYDEIKVTWQRR
jgi:hypothetical protein